MEKQFYIGVKIIEAWPTEQDGAQDYLVKYQNGFISWSPKEAFENAYFPMGNDPSLVSQEMVDGFIESSKEQKIDPKTLLVSAKMVTGFMEHEVSSYVDPKNFDLEECKEICLEKIRDSLWKCLGFVVQWGRFGLKRK